MKEKSVEVLVDDKKFRTINGQKLLGLLKENKINIPSPCHDLNIESNGFCGICVVEIEGLDALQKACTVEVSDGMVIRTNSPRVKTARKTNLALLFEKHYKEEKCANCIWDGDCSFHDLARECKIEPYQCL